ncbi:MAG: pyruvate kinase [Gemmatimonadota bacterium]
MTPRSSQRRTRIIATLGPATDAPGVLEALIEAGLDVARINYSHGTAAEHAERITRCRRIARDASHPLAVLADLPGPKLRVLLSAPLLLRPDQDVTVALAAGVPADFHVTEPEVLVGLRAGQRVLLDDGRLQLRATQSDGARVILRVEVGGTLLPNKGINVPDTRLTIPALTPRDHVALAAAAAAQVDWLALSFVRSPAAATELRDAARGHGLEVPVMAKIERPEAVEQAAEIVDAFDGIMVARGDLGVEIPLEQVPAVQKRLITLARTAGKPVVTATDMLDSMRNSPRPTRAEVNDVANAVYDGTDALMLSGETAVGQYPAAAVSWMGRIAQEADATLGATDRDVPVSSTHVRDHLTRFACALAREIRADAILAPTVSGRTARLVARHRPGIPIVALSSDAVLRQLALAWGVRPVPLDVTSRLGEDRLAFVVRTAFAHGAVEPGDQVVLLADQPVEGEERVPTIRVVRVGEAGQSCEP